MKKRSVFYPISRPIFYLAAISSLTALLITACVGGVSGTNVNIDRLTEVAVAYEGPTDTTMEEDGTVAIMVRLSETPGQQVPIPIEITPQGRATGGDYSSPTTVGFEANDSGAGQTKSLTVGAVKDGVLIELDEWLEIGFGDLPEGVEAGNPNTVTVHIEDKDSNLNVNLPEREDGSNNPITIATLAAAEGVSGRK